jgi:dolichol kinase
MDPLVLYALVLLLLAYRVMCAKRREIAYLVVFLVAGAALALYEGADPLLMLLGVLIFNGMVSTYHSRANYAYFLLAVFFVLPTLIPQPFGMAASTYYYSPTLIPQAMLLGFMSGAYFFMGRTGGASVSVERKRDMIQMVLGLAILGSFVFISAFFVRGLLAPAIIAASAIGNFSVSNRKSAISRALHSFERGGAILGQGAMWLAAGTLAAMSFLNNAGLAAVLAAIFIGDAAATLVGTAYKKPLPYNKKKSAAGTLAYFAATALFSFPFAGYLGLLVGAVAALAESFPIHIDDNFDTAVLLTVLLALLGYAAVAI